MLWATGPALMNHKDFVIFYAMILGSMRLLFLLSLVWLKSAYLSLLLKAQYDQHCRLRIPMKNTYHHGQRHVKKMASRPPLSVLFLIRLVISKLKTSRMFKGQEFYPPTTRMTTGGYLDSKIEHVTKRLLDSRLLIFYAGQVKTKQQVNLPVLDNYGRTRQVVFIPSKLLESFCWLPVNSLEAGQQLHEKRSFRLLWYESIISIHLLIEEPVGKKFMVIHLGTAYF